MKIRAEIQLEREDYAQIREIIARDYNVKREDLRKLVDDQLGSVLRALVNSAFHTGFNYAKEYKYAKL